MYWKETWSWLMKNMNSWSQIIKLTNKPPHQPGSICGNSIPDHSMSIPSSHPDRWDLALPSNSDMRESQSGTELIQISMHDWVAIHLRWFSMSQSSCTGPAPWFLLSNSTNIWTYMGLAGSTHIQVLWAYEKFRDIRISPAASLVHLSKKALSSAMR